MFQAFSVNNLVREMRERCNPADEPSRNQERARMSPIISNVELNRQYADPLTRELFNKLESLFGEGLTLFRNNVRKNEQILVSWTNWGYFAHNLDGTMIKKRIRNPTLAVKAVMLINNS